MKYKIIFIALISSLFFNTLSFSDNFIQADLGIPFRIKLGQTAWIESENIEIKFLNIVDDSRCHANVTCFWRGALIIDIGVTKDKKDLGTFTISDYDLPVLAEKGLFSETSVLEYKIKFLYETGGAVELSIKKL